MSEDKEYAGTLTLGATTDTQDRARQDRGGKTGARN